MGVCPAVRPTEVRCKTAGLEDKNTACQMLVCYARELKEGFADYTEQVAKIMVPLLKFSRIW